MTFDVISNILYTPYKFQKTLKTNTKAYYRPCQTFKMEPFVKVVNGWKP